MRRHNWQASAFRLQFTGGLFDSVRRLGARRSRRPPPEIRKRRFLAPCEAGFDTPMAGVLAINPCISPAFCWLPPPYGESPGYLSGFRPASADAAAPRRPLIAAGARVM
jgi:hypothetical protein